MVWLCVWHDYQEVFSRIHKLVGSVSAARPQDDVTAVGAECAGTADHQHEQSQQELQPSGLPSFTLKVRPCEHSDTAAAVLPDGLAAASAGADPPLIEQLRPLPDDELRSDSSCSLIVLLSYT